MTNKLSDKDKKDWQNFIDSSKKIESRISKRTIDLHGYTLEEANKEISKFIENCYLNKVKKINVITGKGMRSKNLDEPYQSKDLSILKYSVPEYSRVKIIIFDVLGRKIKTLVDDNHDPGNHLVEWDATNERGINVSSGLYFYKIQSGE